MDILEEKYHVVKGMVDGVITWEEYEERLCVLDALDPREQK